MKSATDKIYENLSFTHKIHEKQCEVLSYGSVLIRLLSVALIVTVLFLQFWQLIFAQPTKTLAIWSVILTVTEVGVAFFQLNFNYDKLLDQHREAAKSALMIKNRLLVDKSNRLSDKELMAYVDEVNKVYASAPQTGRFAKWLVNRDKEK